MRCLLWTLIWYFIINVSCRHFLYRQLFMFPQNLLSGSWFCFCFCLKLKRFYNNEKSFNKEYSFFFHDSDKYWEISSLHMFSTWIWVTNKHLPRYQNSVALALYFSQAATSFIPKHLYWGYCPFPQMRCFICKKNRFFCYCSNLNVFRLNSCHF